MVFNGAALWPSGGLLANRAPDCGAARGTVMLSQQRLYGGTLKIDHDAAAFLFGHLNAALATVDDAGGPFASAVNLVPDGNGRLLMLTSRLAVHTGHMEANPRASVMVLDAAGADWQAVPRMTLTGAVESVEADEGERYLSLFPGAREYLSLDFAFSALVPRRARWIPGFARAAWLDAAALGLALPWSPDREQEMVAHMNEDHGDALSHYASLLGRQPETVEMVALDPWGAWLHLDGEPVRLPFPESVRTPRAVRETLVALANRPLS